MTFCSRSLVFVLACSTIAPRSAAAQTAPDQFVVQEHRLTVAPHGGWVELVVRALPGPTPPRAGLVQTLSVTPESSGFRALIHPDTLADFLDSAEARIRRARELSYARFDGATMGALPTLLLRLESTSAAFGPPAELRVQGCSSTGIWSYVDTTVERQIVRSLRQAIDSARTVRRGGSPLADPGIACPARPLAGSVVVPTLTRSAVGRHEPEDFTVEVTVDGTGNVAAIRRRTPARGFAALDVAIRGWRFQPATGPDGLPRASTVALRVHYRTIDPLVDLDSVTSLRVSAAAAGASFVVIGHVIDEQHARSVTADGVTLYVDDGGTRLGTPIVIALAAGTRVEQLVPVLEQLRQQRRVITYDLRGHGRSSAARDYSLEAHVRDLAAVLDRLHLERVVLAGAGVGGVAALEVARRQPERVSGVALLGPAGDYALEDAPRVSVTDSIARELATVGRASALRRFFAPADSLALEWVVRDLRTTRRSALIGTLQAAAHYDFSQALVDYPGPKLILLPGLAPGGVLRQPFATAHDDVARLSYPSGRWLYLANALSVGRQLEAFAYFAEWTAR